MDQIARSMIAALAQLLRHAPEAVVPALLSRLDDPRRAELLTGHAVAPVVVEHVLTDGTTADRVALARNAQTERALLVRLLERHEYEVDRAVYAHRRTGGALRRAIAPAAHVPERDTQALVALLRGHQRVRHALRILDAPHRLDLDLLMAEHRREPLPPGAVEALILSGDCPRAVVLALLDTGGARSYGRWWYRPAVRAVRTGAVTPAELVRHHAPRERTLLLPSIEVRTGLRWNDAERTAVQREIERLLSPADRGSAPGSGSWRTEDSAPSGTGGRAAVLAELAHIESWPQIARRKRALAAGLITGDDVILHGAPALRALDERYWLGHLECFDLPGAVTAAHACVRAFTRAALGEDPGAWWSAAQRLPDFAGTLPELFRPGLRGTRFPPAGPMRQQWGA
ncbi:hypothetical protein ACFVXE_37135 [Streptomyces sp. NPDC058231]|uniref:hypothetical protein n=1 Tax=Streptomyces sp. NPDC058231 TaxID=3346392 RepID=UPI0036EBFEE2